MRRGLRQRRHLLILGAAAILVVSVGVAYAAIPDANGVIKGCFKKSGHDDDDDDGGPKGSLRVIDTAKGEKCKKNETALSWNQKGPKGDKGDKGDTGAQGAQGVQGPQGPQGAQGVKGADGAPGAQGEPGAKGDKGDPGADGAAGAAGATGATGAQGAPGPAGPQGPPGSTTFAGSVCSPNGLFCLEIKNEGVFIKRAGHKVLKVTLSDVELEE